MLRVELFTQWLRIHDEDTPISVIRTEITWDPVWIDHNNYRCKPARNLIQSEYGSTVVGKKWCIIFQDGGMHSV